MLLLADKGCGVSTSPGCRPLNQFSLTGKVGASSTSVPTGFLSIQMTWLASVLVQMDNKLLYLNTVLGRSDLEPA